MSSNSEYEQRQFWIILEECKDSNVDLIKSIIAEGMERDMRDKWKKFNEEYPNVLPKNI